MMFRRDPSPFVFVHIPRTSGVALCASLGGQTGVKVSAPADRHMRAAVAPLVIGEDVWAMAKKFSIVRNPWDIVASDYRLTASQAGIGSATQNMTAGWDARVARLQADRSFERFVAEEYLGQFSGIVPGGFWRTWCTDEDGVEMGIRPIAFEQLADPATWTELLDWLGLQACPRLRINRSPAIPAEWTAELIRRVGELCCEDVARFGFSPPTTA